MSEVSFKECRDYNERFGRYACEECHLLRQCAHDEVIEGDFDEYDEIDDILNGEMSNADYSDNRGF